jgi:uncharacterized spore protein YtfJ
MGDELSSRALETLEHARQAIVGQRVFGEAYEVGDVTVIPVSVVRGGGGGGGGEGRGLDDPQAADRAPQGSGGGAGFGIDARPVGVYVVKGDEVEWKPAVNRMKAIVGGQVVAVVALLTVRKIFGKR